VPEFRIRSPPVLSRRRAPKNAVRRPPELLNSFHMPAIKLPLGITTGLKTLGVDPTELLRRSGLPLTLVQFGADRGDHGTGLRSLANAWRAK
jgi:hypothetical protein